MFIVGREKLFGNVSNFVKQGDDKGVNFAKVTPNKVAQLPDQAVPTRTARQQKWLSATRNAPPQ